jgi:hypothetical protein
MQLERIFGIDGHIMADAAGFCARTMDMFERGTRHVGDGFGLRGDGACDEDHANSFVIPSLGITS